MIHEFYKPMSSNPDPNDYSPEYISDDVFSRAERLLIRGELGKRLPIGDNSSDVYLSGPCMIYRNRDGFGVLCDSKYGAEVVKVLEKLGLPIIRDGSSDNSTGIEGLVS